ncbi:hypothetical protein CIJ83_11160 [Neisseria meningitidis]|nr:hypothetical protein [Neisseria meningitidis]MBG8769780.1 hypothetical protein [Neisseria meningitidis]PVZ40862.1 hypothetical protein DEF53_08395 [Neisseria meningitidis]QEM94385.1 hypothetical protein CCD87_00125 [Neisseria meningitidis]QEN62486.1 hypothetical protein CCD90_00125 [Neisseria meningitidis]
MRQAFQTAFLKCVYLWCSKRSSESAASAKLKRGINEVKICLNLKGSLHPNPLSRGRGLGRGWQTESLLGRHFQCAGCFYSGLTKIRTRRRSRRQYK